MFVNRQHMLKISDAQFIPIQRHTSIRWKDPWFIEDNFSAIRKRWYVRDELSSSKSAARAVLFFPLSRFLPSSYLTGVELNVHGLFLFQYEPVIQPGSHDYLHHMTLYECRRDQALLESAAKTSGSVCYEPNQPSLECNTIAAIWSLGSEVCYVTHLNINEELNKFPIRHRYRLEI